MSACKKKKFVNAGINNLEWINREDWKRKIKFKRWHRKM